MKLQRRPQLLGDWPVGAWCVPAGTIIDANDPQWRGIPLPRSMPMNAKALDQPAYDALAGWYGEDFWHLLHYAEGIQPKWKQNG